MDDNKLRETIIDLAIGLIGQPNQYKWTRKQVDLVNMTRDELALPLIENDYEFVVDVAVYQAIQLTVRAGTREDAEDMIADGKFSAEVIASLNHAVANIVFEGIHEVK